MLQYTGGTTGVPKGAILTHRNLVANALQCRAWIEPNLPKEQGSVLTPLPLYHIFSLTANLLAFALMGGLEACSFPTRATSSGSSAPWRRRASPP